MTELERILAKTLMDLIVSIDLAEDDDIDPDVATALLEPIAAHLNTTSASNRQALSTLLLDIAQQETDPGWQPTALDLPAALGLV
ncbi:hypothetical protein [Actinomadura citrea]|uniref:Ethanolamine utilization protein EutP (Predicted NTPase) n=1 Tax=Actinomadura citrea TaxID=46158 RepID=A0A7Y9GE93_9ACTN|nr:hypothetical protein [Actinomadura citrea]NYE14937.1 ethanolamine utilization protein EutP (predicted NTPase) [Actinomadura citrea]GGU11270.1 hypothetical protein GCM10010177_82480 [Actinomadura citrea]